MAVSLVSASLGYCPDSVFLEEYSKQRGLLGHPSKLNHGPEWGHETFQQGYRGLQKTGPVSVCIRLSQLKRRAHVLRLCLCHSAFPRRAEFSWSWVIGSFAAGHLRGTGLSFFGVMEGHGEMEFGIGQEDQEKSVMLEKKGYCREKGELSFPREMGELRRGSPKMSGEFSASPGFKLQESYRAGFC